MAQMSKGFLLLILSISFFGNISAQTDSAEDDDLYTRQTIESKAQFPGEHESMIRFKAQNLEYPQFAQEEAISGTVVITCGRGQWESYRY